MSYIVSCCLNVSNRVWFMIEWLNIILYICCKSTLLESICVICDLLSKCWKLCHSLTMWNSIFNLVNLVTNGVYSRKWQFIIYNFDPNLHVFRAMVAFPGMIYWHLLEWELLFHVWLGCYLVNIGIESHKSVPAKELAPLRIESYFDHESYVFGQLSPLRIWS